MDCRELRSLADAYLDGELPPASRAEIEAHLAGCPHCRAYLAQIEETIKLAGRVEPDSLEPEARETLLDMYRRVHGDDPQG